MKETTAKAHNANLTGSIEILENKGITAIDFLLEKRGLAKKKPKRKGFKSIRRDPLDALFSEYIRRRVYHDGEITCQRCGYLLNTKGIGTYYDTTREDGSTKPAWMSLECAHFKGRGQQSVRFDPDNALALCSGCHQVIGSDHDEAIRVFECWLGKERLDLLRARAVETGKIDRPAIKLWLKQELQKLNGV